MSESFNATDYGLYFEHDFRHRWLKPQILEEKLEKFRNFPSLSFEQIGESIEGRGIGSIRWGSGKVKLLIWSQMHGNEPTATMAIVDVLSFLTKSDSYDQLRKDLAKELSIIFIPMLNPDGAERFTRQAALAFDLNRDAATQQCPEIQAFMKLLKSFKPHWGFNLHDQRSIFSAGNSRYPATMSFLAASASYDKQITPAREKSMKLISLLADSVEQHLPHHTGRYSDEFYPRALGDYFHQQEIPCVLIESGAYYKDPYRDQARKLNFLCLLRAFQLIATNEYEEEEIDGYLSIPENKPNFYDLIIRGCRLYFNDQTLSADIGLHIKEELNYKAQHLERKYILKEVGDLSFHCGLSEEEGGEIYPDREDLQLDQPANLRIKRENKPDIIIKSGVIE